jgi:flavocytochrome c
MLIVAFLLVASVSAVNLQLRPPKVLYDFLPNGDIDDVQCNIEDVERANDSQLNVIFRELLQTNFFRHFVVDLEHKCPLSLWNSVGDSDSESEEEKEEDEDEDEDEYECTSGMDELDEDAEPLCTVQAGDDDGFGGFGGFGMPPSGDVGGDPFASSVLQSLSKSGFSSIPQRETFDWQDQTDMVVQEDESPCDEEDPNLPDIFWMDMCNNIQEGDGKKLVDLALNPERYTGYNGTHIWKAIYEENCITTSDSCLEERVLYRLLSGLHTSTTVSIAKNYYPPSKRKNRLNWEPNPQFFMEQFQRHPEHVRNLHFGYVVLLRAIRKATNYLQDYEIQSGNTMDDKASKVLLKRLLDTAILQSCSSVFTAFDESVMFQESHDISLQQNFKGVFHNISSILDCVQCQQCKLHGKMAMMGYGTALKILFVSPENLVLERNEVVALINTVGRLSESLIDVHELTAMYWEQEEAKGADVSGETETLTPAPASWMERLPVVESLDLVDATVGAIAALGREDLVSLDREKELVELALSKNPELLILGKHYGNDVQRFFAMTSFVGALGLSQTQIQAPDAVIIGSGLAGLAAALNILDRGGTVVLLEKEHRLGGNSNKASSGINGCCPQNDTYNDSLDSFRNDTIKSAGPVADLPLIDALVENSEKAVLWLRERANVDLSLLAQLGGHAHKRTHRPSNGMAGAEIMYHMQKEVRAFEKKGRVTILVDSRVTELLTKDDRVVGVACESTIDGSVQEIYADTVILATGGFASDRSDGSYLHQYRPELMSFPATAGSFSTGDGITLATTLGASTRDMDKVQIHPTGWVDPKDPSNPTKVLAAELMRGVGGILVNKQGERFCDELGTRAYVTDKMLQHDPYYASNGIWKDGEDVQTFSLILSSSAAADGKKHVDLYSHKGLLTRIEGITALAKHIGVDKKSLQSTMRKYQEATSKGEDEFGKTSFRGVPAQDLSEEVFYVGTVTPVLHYCMGGIKIDAKGHVLREDETPIQGLRAAGEITGGVHGDNRLGGNSLLECTVYGTIVGESVPVKGGDYRIALSVQEKVKKEVVATELSVISLEELSKHNTEEDLWVAVHGVVYDFTDFAHEHPSGFESIFELAGTDGTGAFAAVHNKGMLEDFEEDKKALLASG